VFAQEAKLPFGRQFIDKQNANLAVPKFDNSKIGQKFADVQPTSAGLVCEQGAEFFDFRLGFGTPTGEAE